METVKELDRITGGRWYGVSVFDRDVKGKKEFISPHVDRFCEVLGMASIYKVLLDPLQFTCPGARYAFGCGTDLKEEMVRKLAEEKNYSPGYANKLIDDTPHCQERPAAIGLNLSIEPDVLIAQLQPEQVMRLIQVYHKKLKKPFHPGISSVISACGNVTVKALQTQDMAISFGCNDSRAFGGLSRDRLYIGLPYSLVEKLIQ
jgi:uncharacterized protein (DUF169 family)